MKYHYPRIILDITQYKLKNIKNEHRSEQNKNIWRRTRR